MGSLLFMIMTEFLGCLLQHDQDSREKTGDTMAPILPHSDMEDTTKEFCQNHEQQGDQMLPYRGVTTGSTIRISNMLVHPGRSVKTTNRVPTGISKSIVTDGDTDTGPPNLDNIKYKGISCHTNIHHLHIGNQDSSVSSPAVGLLQHDQDSSLSTHTFSTLMSL